MTIVSPCYCDTGFFMCQFQFSLVNCHTWEYQTKFDREKIIRKKSINNIWLYEIFFLSLYH